MRNARTHDKHAGTDHLGERDTDRPLSLSHLDEQGNARMVDTGHKSATARRALAYACVRMQPETARLLREGMLAKGDALAVARVAGIAAAKETPRLIPLCHNINLTSVKVDFSWAEQASDAETSVLEIRTTARATDRTGVEMEALVAAGIAGLTIYDMCKGVDKTLEVDSIMLLEKDGGATTYRRASGPNSDKGD